MTQVMPMMKLPFVSLTNFKRIVFIYSDRLIKSTYQKSVFQIICKEKALVDKFYIQGIAELLAIIGFYSGHNNQHHIQYQYSDQKKNSNDDQH